MDKKVLSFSFAASLLMFFSIASLFIYQIVTTYEAHATFEGYCHWRGLDVVNQSANYGYCIDNVTGQNYKIVLFNGRWYLDGDLSGSGPF